MLHVTQYDILGNKNMVHSGIAILKNMSVNLFFKKVNYKYFLKILKLLVYWLNERLLIDSFNKIVNMKEKLTKIEIRNIF